MAERSGSVDSRSVDLAINRVLAAERDARAAVETCREDAERILDQAEAHSRRISRRSEQRVKAAHQIADARVERTLRRLAEDDVHGLAGPVTETDEERLERALERLVDEIVGGSP